MEIKQFENLIKQTYYKDTDDIDFVEGMKKGMVEQLGDPYSRYLNKEEFKRMMEDTAGNFVGIGVYIAPNKNGEIVVVSPIKDTPAEKAGLRKGDKILAIGGEPIYYFSDVSPAINLVGNTHSIPFTIEREGVRMELKVVPNGDKKIGVSGFQSEGEVHFTNRQYGLGEALAHGVQYGYDVLRDYVSQFKFIFTKKVNYNNSCNYSTVYCKSTFSNINHR